MEDKTLRGALGTELQNKSFETYECSKNIDTRIFTVKQIATRKYDMPSRIDFCLSKDGLPMPCTAAENTAGIPEGAGQGNVNEIFRTSMMGHSEMRAGALKAQVRMRYRITSDSLYGSLLGEALRQGVLVKRVVSDHEVYYQPGPSMYEQSLNFDG